jgi:hypothetical protein
MLVKYEAWKALSRQEIPYPSQKIRELTWGSEEVIFASNLIKPFTSLIGLHCGNLGPTFTSVNFAKAVPDALRTLVGFAFAGYLVFLSKQKLGAADKALVANALSVYINGAKSTTIGNSFSPLAKSFFGTILVNLGITNLNLGEANDSTGNVVNPDIEVLTQACSQVPLYISTLRKGFPLKSLPPMMQETYQNPFVLQVVTDINALKL